MNDERHPSWGRLAPAVYGPMVLFGLGQGALIPVVPIIANGLGANIGLSGIIASSMVIGQLLGNIPASWCVARIGERRSMVLAGTVGVAAALCVFLTTTLWLLTLAVLAVGLGATVFGLARHTLITTRAPLPYRARALSLLGGSRRLGTFAGPFVTAALVFATANDRAPACVLAVALTLAVVLVQWGPDPAKLERVSGNGAAAAEGVLRAAWQHRAQLSRLGPAAAMLMGVRAARDVLLPLWGLSLGLDTTAIALIVGVSGAIDFALFYTSGQVMDRWGRLAAILPAMVAMGAGFLTLSVTKELERAEMWMVICAIVLGLGNGLSSGTLMTVGSDLAPSGSPASFLATWRTLGDLGGASTPVLLSGLATISLPLASVAVGIMACTGAAVFARWLPRYLPGRDLP